MTSDGVQNTVSIIDYLATCKLTAMSNDSRVKCDGSRLRYIKSHSVHYISIKYNYKIVVRNYLKLNE